MTLKVLADTIAGNFDRITDKEFRRRVEELIIANRAELIRRSIDKHGISTTNLIQQINCMPTTEVDIAECCSITLGCNVTRTEEKIPQPIRIRDRSSNFNYVGTIDSKLSFSYIDIETFELLSEERFFNENQIIYMYVNGYLYIYGSNPRNIRVRGIFSDPREVVDLNNCINPNEDCADNEVEISDDLVTNIIDITTNQLRATVIIPEHEEVKLEDANVSN